MKRNEVRFGNYIVDNSEDSKTGYIQVDAVLMELIMYHPETFEPIPLTEEWLLKLGFEFKGESCGSKIYTIAWQFDWNKKPSVLLKVVDFVYQATGDYFKGWLVPLTDGEYFMSQRNVEIKYVHQLQNLYFDLTVKELELRETTLQIENSTDRKGGFQSE